MFCIFYKKLCKLPEISLYDNSNLGEVTFQKKGGGGEGVLSDIIIKSLSGDFNGWHVWRVPPSCHIKDPLCRFL